MKSTGWAQSTDNSRDEGDKEKPAKEPSGPGARRKLKSSVLQTKQTKCYKEKEEVVAVSAATDRLCD